MLEHRTASKLQLMPENYTMPDHASESQNDSHAVKSALLLQAEAAIASRKAREAEAREVEVELDYIDASADPIEPAPESLPDESDAQEVTPQEAQRQNSERFLASLNGPKPKTARKSVKAPWQIETARYRREEGRVVRNLYARTLYGVNKRTNEGCAPRDYVTGLPP